MLVLPRTLLCCFIVCIQAIHVTILCTFVFSKSLFRYCYHKWPCTYFIFIFLSVYIWDMFLEIRLLGHRTNKQMLLEITIFLSKAILILCISIINIGKCFINLYPQRILPNFWILANSICEKWESRCSSNLQFLIMSKA